jgi:hypothetical protein
VEKSGGEIHPDRRTSDFYALREKDARVLGKQSPTFIIRHYQQKQKKNMDCTYKSIEQIDWDILNTLVDNANAEYDTVSFKGMDDVEDLTEEDLLSVFDPTTQDGDVTETENVHSDGDRTLILTSDSSSDEEEDEEEEVKEEIKEEEQQVKEEEQEVKEEEQSFYLSNASSDEEEEEEEPVTRQEEFSYVHSSPVIIQEEFNIHSSLVTMQEEPVNVHIRQEEFSYSLPSSPSYSSSPDYSYHSSPEDDLPLYQLPFTPPRDRLDIDVDLHRGRGGRGGRGRGGRGGRGAVDGDEPVPKKRRYQRKLKDPNMPEDRAYFPIGDPKSCRRCFEKKFYCSIRGSICTQCKSDSQPYCMRRNNCVNILPDEMFFV